MKSWKKYLSIAGVLFVLALTAVVTIPVNAETDETSTIPQRVYFGEVAVGGMTQEEAKTAVEEYISGKLDQKVTLQAGKNTVQVPVSQFGISWGNPEIAEEAVGLGKSGNLITRYKAMKDLENEDKVYDLSYKVDESMISRVLESNAQTLNTEAKDGGLTRENGSFTVVPGSQGVSINIDNSKEILQKYFSSEWDGTISGSIELAADVVEPRGSEAELGKVKDLLGGFHTSYSSSGAGRSKNVENGASLINGSVVYPGDTFSVYEAVSPFDAEHGYELAGSYENGTTVETYGGGICQVSTTLYNAVIRAELEIAERFNHSMIVSYVDPSADAAIAGTYKDLKFTNNTDAPIYIEGYTEGRELYFNVFGEETRPANREVSFVSETLSTTEPGTQYQASSGHAIGYISQKQSSHTGYTAQLWKVVTVDGVEKSREIFNKSTYKASPRIVVVGTASANPEAVNAMNAAIGTQNEGAISAAAAQWNDAAQQAAAQQAAIEAQQAAEAAQQQQLQQQQEQEQQEGQEKPKEEKPKDEEEKPNKQDKKEKEEEGDDE
ncbi:VanW family protein [Lachnospiraceae bacterium 45-W7]